MKTQEIWNQNIPKPKDPKSELTNQVWACDFNVDNNSMIVVVGDAILLYDSTGDMLNNPIRNAHKEIINDVCFSADGKRFVTVSNDKTVLIWNYNSEAEQNKIKAECKIGHSDRVICCAINPVTGYVFAGGVSDYSLWYPDTNNKNVKHQYKHKILCASWNKTGQLLATGTYDGVLEFWNRDLQSLYKINKEYSIASMDWSPITPDEQESMLIIGQWNQTISFFNASGKQMGIDKKLSYVPLSINFHQKGELFIIGGSNHKSQLFTRDANFLIDICEKDDWIWCSKFKNDSLHVGVCSNNGDIALHKVQALDVYSLYQLRYAYRDSLTDVCVDNLQVNQRVRLKCKELVKGVSLYKDKLLTYQQSRVIIYSSTVSADGQFKYRITRKINKAFTAQCIYILANHLLCYEKNKLQLLQFSGEVEREWVFDSIIKSVKVLGGPAKREAALIGLKSGILAKVFADNSFPITLINHQYGINKCDISLNQKQAAIIDGNKNLNVYNIITKELLFTEQNITSFMYNSDFNESMVYSDDANIFVKTGNMPALQQKFVGEIIGFKKNKVYFINNNSNQVNTIDVTQSVTMNKYIEKKEFQKAYDLALLSISKSDYKQLGTEALQNGEFEIAKKCFNNINDQDYIHLLMKHERLSKRGLFKEAILQAELQAYQSNFNKAAEIYDRNNSKALSLQMFLDVKDWVEIEKRKNNVDDGELKQIMRMQADWQLKQGQWEQAARIYIQIRDYSKAIDLYGKNNNLEGLVEVSNILDKTEHEPALRQAADYFKKMKQYNHLKQVYLTLNDKESLIKSYVELEQFEDALQLGNQNRKYLDYIKPHYAQWLLKNDKYEKALLAYRDMRDYEKIQSILQTLSKNAIQQNRFQDASLYYWQLATESLQLIRSYKKPDLTDLQDIENFEKYSNLAEIFAAYKIIYAFIEEPFQTLSGEDYLLSIFNAAKFIIAKLNQQSIFGIKSSYIYYSLGKVSKHLEAFKTARQCYDKILLYKIPNTWQDEIELSSLQIKAKPFSDKEQLLGICGRCMNPQPIIQFGVNCMSCKHPNQYSLVSFTQLHLVEFVTNLPHEQVMQLLSQDNEVVKKKKRKGGNNQWSESQSEGQNVLKFNGGNANDDEETPFTAKINEILQSQQVSNEYIPIQVDEEILQTMNIDDVVIVNYGALCGSFPIRYFINMMEGIVVKSCEQCSKFFLLDEFEFEYLKSKHCPFCQNLDAREGEQKGIFEV